MKFSAILFCGVAAFSAFAAPCLFQGLEEGDHYA